MNIDAVTPKAFRLSRRNLLVAASAMTLPGCIQSPAVVNAYRVAKTQILGHPDLPLSREAIAKLPYASMTARVGRGPQALLLLGRIAGADQHWISGVDRSALVTRGGRVVSTYGFPENLRQTHGLGQDPVAAGLQSLETVRSYSRGIDVEPGHQFGLLIDSQFHPVGHRKIVIRDVELDTILVRETNRARTVQWEFENLYWVDPGDGFVWKSTQHIARTFPPVAFEILKPPG